MENIPADHSPVLVVDDDPGLLLSIKATLLSAGMPDPGLVEDSRRVVELVKQNGFQVVLLDLMMPHIDGLALLQQLSEELPDVECIVITAVDDVETAVKAMSLGAYDYLVKPLNSEKLIIVVSRALERYNLKQRLNLLNKPPSFSDLNHPEAFKEIIAADESMATVFRLVEAVAPTDYCVIINGESGTGKEMVARAIHRLSHRCRAPFIAVNMAAVSQTIFEDAFFGHTKGAFTDAVSEKMGFFEAADGGTLFLDEITELDPALQGKLLRVIEERELYRLGSTQVRNVDVRIIAATNRDISKEIERKRFRADLYYRLNMYNIKIPPLRQRSKDILPLARHFAGLHAEANGKRIDALAPELADALQAYHFPGNVRELEHIVASAVLLAEGPVLDLASAAQMLPQARSGDGPTQQALISLDEVEKRHILNVLKATCGNRVKAAEILGINASTVYRKIQKYGLTAESKP
jgi:DNA-binding NtrC family response regulator